MTNLPPIESYKKYELYEVNVGCVGLGITTHNT